MTVPGPGTLGTRAPCLRKRQGGGQEGQSWASEAEKFQHGSSLILLAFSIPSVSSEQRSSQALRVSHLALTLPQLLGGARWRAASPSR